MGRVRTLWREASRVDRLACVVVGLTCLSAFATWPVVSAVSPDMAAIASWTRDSDPESRQDPWGRPFVVVQRPALGANGRLIYSLGRDGKNDLGRGDDVVLFDPVGKRGPSGRVHAGALLLSQSLGFFLLLALFIAGTYFAARRGPPAQSLGKELLRTLMLSVPVSVLASTMAFLSSYTLVTDASWKGLRDAMVVPPTIALIGAVFVCSFLAILCVRLLHSEGGFQAATASPQKETLEEASQRWLSDVKGDAASRTTDPPHGRSPSAPPA